MANRSFLVASDSADLYPSSREANFSPAEQTVAAGIYCVPLLWLPLFRLSDLKTQTLENNGEPLTVTAPVVAVDTAIQQLQSATEFLSLAFAKQGSLAEYIPLPGNSNS